MPAARILEILLQTIVESSERYIEVSTTPTQANTPAKTGTALGHGTILPYPSQICSLCSLIWTEQITLEFLPGMEKFKLLNRSQDGVLVDLFWNDVSHWHHSDMGWSRENEIWKFFISDPFVSFWSAEKSPYIKWNKFGMDLGPPGMGTGWF